MALSVEYDDRGVRKAFVKKLADVSIGLRIASHLATQEDDSRGFGSLCDKGLA